TASPPSTSPSDTASPSTKPPSGSSASVAPRLLDGRAVVLLEKSVWLAFGGREDVEPLIWYCGSVPAFKPACVAWVPYPGSKNCWYDNEHQRGATANFMRLLAEGEHPNWSEESA
ncbi:hypothetical protein LCGC14_2397460, partial [marine sediment metagenome]